MSQSWGRPCPTGTRDVPGFMETPFLAGHDEKMWTGASHGTGTSPVTLGWFGGNLSFSDFAVSCEKEYSQCTHYTYEVL